MEKFHLRITINGPYYPETWFVTPPLSDEGLKTVQEIGPTLGIETINNSLYQSDQWHDAIAAERTPTTLTVAPLNRALMSEAHVFYEPETPPKS